MGGSALIGALVLAGVALLGAMAPGVQVLWSRHRDILLAMSAGLLAGTASVHLLPVAAAAGESMGPAFLGGFLGVLLLEAGLHRLLPAHQGDPSASAESHMSVSALVGFGLHGVVDGVALSTAASARTAGITTGALVVHHLPLALSCASLLKVGGRPGLFWPLMLAASAMPVVGVLLADNVLAGAGVTPVLSAVAAGVFLYVASHNLLPVMDLGVDNLPRVLAVFAGAGLVFLGHVLGN